MKTYIFHVTIVLCLVCRNARCDVIPPNSHFVNKCVVITNVNDYPDISLLGVTTCVAYCPKIYIIGPTTCLEKGYKLNCLAIYAVSNSYLAGKDINKIDWSADKHAFKTNIQIDPSGDYADNSNFIYSINQYYKIVGFTDTSVEIYKYREVDYFYNGSIAITSSGKYNGDSTKLSQSLPAETKVTSGSLGKETNLFPNAVKSDLAPGSYFVNVIIGEAIETKKITGQSRRYGI